jgi:hypothetical protein
MQRKRRVEMVRVVFHDVLKEQVQDSGKYDVLDGVNLGLGCLPLRFVGVPTDIGAGMMLED